MPLTTAPQASARGQARAAWLTSGRVAGVRLQLCVQGACALPSGLGGQPSGLMRVLAFGLEGAFAGDMEGQARGLLLPVEWNWRT